MTTVAIIPARGGSKRIPHKNVREFCGKPMIVWSIEAAKSSGLFDRIIVSTDDNTIAEIASRAGADVPFLRPAELSDDITPTRPVIAHAISALAKSGFHAEYVCCLYATAPFVRTQDLVSAFKELRESGARYVFPVATFDYPIQRALKLSSDGEVSMFDPSQFSKRSQDLEDAYHDVGQFYWANAKQWQTDEPVFAPGSKGIPIPRYLAQDIDTDEDWNLAERLFTLDREGI